MNSAHTINMNSLTSLVVNMSSKNRWTAALMLPVVVGPAWCFAFVGCGRIGTLAGLVLFAALIASAITDYHGQRIYNWTTYSAILWALAINLVVSAISLSEVALPSLEPAATIGPQFLGGIGITESLAGAAVCFVVTLFGYDLSGGGAGDVKLATAIGALLGLHAGIFAIAYSYLVAAIAILIWTTYQHGPFALLKAGFRKVCRLLGKYFPIPMTSEDEKILLTPVPLGPYFAIGTLLVVLEIVPT